MPRKYLRFAEDPNFKVDPSILSEVIAVLGTRGGGKTYTMKDIVEEARKIDWPVVIVDPMHAWWGLRSSADGKDPGLPIAIFGGENADLPLEPEMGNYMADYVASEGLSCIFDIRPWSKTKRRHFVADFAERLLEKNTDPVFVVFEETHKFAPQTTREAGDKRMLGAVTDLATEGRGHGIGLGIVSQRAARVNKDLLEEADNLIMMRTQGTNDRKAMRNWITTHELDEETYVPEVMRALPRLTAGNGYLWSPTRFEEPVLLKMRVSETFDSSKTPEPGQRRRKPKTVADIDIDALREQMSEAVQKAEQEDPKFLKRRVAELERELKNKVDPKETIKEVKIIDPKVAKKLDELLRQFQTAGTQLVNISTDVLSGLDEVKKSQKDLRSGQANERTSGEGRSSAATSRGRTGSADAVGARRGGTRPAPSSSGHLHAVPDDIKLGAASRRMVAALRENPDGLTRPQLASFAGVPLTRSTFKNAMSELRKYGLIVEDRDRIYLSELGVAVAGGVEDTPKTPEEVQQRWLSKVGAAARRMLEVLLGTGQQFWIDKYALAEESRVDPEKSTFKNAMSELRKHSLIQEDSEDGVAAASFLFGA